MLNHYASLKAELSDKKVPLALQNVKFDPRCEELPSSMIRILKKLRICMWRLLATEVAHKDGQHLGQPANIPAKMASGCVDKTQS